ncbi:MAG: hypothetical protein ACYC0V_00325 [Armatimonadota bacterium]
MSIDSKIVIEAARKAALWMISQQGPDGRYGTEADLNAYYKSPYPLRIAGEPTAAARCMDYTVERFMTSDGDFMNSPSERTAGTYTRYYCQIYANFWMLRAACALNRFDLAQRIFGLLMSCQDQATGGAYYEVDRKSGVLDSNSTACLCIAGMMFGNQDMAVKAGDVLLKWIAIQPTADRFYLRWRPSGGSVIDFDESESLYYIVDTKKSAQYYWQVGLPQAALAKLYQVTAQEKYLAGSIALYNFLMSCQPDVIASPPVGKLGWGSAILYRATSDTRYLETNREITQYYLDIQHKDGYWLAPAYKSIEEQPLKLSTDITAEFCAWLLDYMAELG